MARGSAHQQRLCEKWGVDESKDDVLAFPAYSSVAPSLCATLDFLEDVVASDLDVDEETLLISP